MKSVKPLLYITLDITCPECGHDFDMLIDNKLNEASELLEMILPESSWIDAHESFECNVICPECSVEFCAKGIDY